MTWQTVALMSLGSPVKAHWNVAGTEVDVELVEGRGAIVGTEEVAEAVVRGSRRVVNCRFFTTPVQVGVTVTGDARRVTV